MDPLTQGLLGATVASSFAKKDNIKVAAFCGAISGMAPDLDILIRSSSDPLLAIEYHRHFTHSLAFIPIGALLVSVFLYFILKNKSSFKDVFVYALLGFATHGLLDSCTGYGTRLYWPISDYRVAWNIIGIIDPIYTVILFVTMLVSFVTNNKLFIRCGVILSLCYLSLGVIQRESVKDEIIQIAKSRDHDIERILVKPTIGNIILWRTVYLAKGKYFIDAVRKPFFGNTVIYEGSVIDYITRDELSDIYQLGKVARKDLDRFSYFSQDFIYQYSYSKNIIADLRYGSLPHDDKSLWGINMDGDKKQHLDFVNLRAFDNRHYAKFWQMLKGDKSLCGDISCIVVE